MDSNSGLGVIMVDDLPTPVSEAWAATKDSDKDEDAGVFSEFGLDCKFIEMIHSVTGEASMLKIAEEVHDKAQELETVSPEELELKKAMEEGLDLTSALGQRFQRLARVAKKNGDAEFEQYSGGHAAKAAFRARWVKNKYDTVVEKRMQRQEWTALKLWWRVRSSSRSA